jgi:hypothetical protein
MSRPSHEDATEAAASARKNVRKLVSGNKHNQLRSSDWHEDLFHIRVEAILDCKMVLPTLAKADIRFVTLHHLQTCFAGQGLFELLFQSLVNLPLFEAVGGKDADFGRLTGLQRAFQQGFPQASGTIHRMVPRMPWVGTGSIR